MEVLKTIVEAHPFLQGLSPEHLKILTKDAVVVEFETGELIFREGECANKMFLIQRGKVALESHTPERDIFIQTIGADEVLGWSWLFPPFSWHFQARALEPTVAVQLNGAHLLIASENDAKFGHELMKRISRVVIRRLQETRRQLIDVCNKVELELGETI